MRRLQLVVLALILILQPVTAIAGMFSDVTDDHPFKTQIESLASKKIINGYSDGTYGPDKEVNRAEWLKLLYAATGRTPKAIYAKCFSDVTQGAWFELYVCDAASHENSFVQGYSDGKFRPSNSVSRVEALKMLYMVFGLPTPDVSELDRSIIKFVDVSVSAWYTKYLSAAYSDMILPISGIGGARFYPDKPLLRGEAAGLISNAFDAKRRIEEAMKEQSSSSSAALSSSAGSNDQFVIKKVTFPFTDSDQFTGTKPISYMFTLTASKTVVNIDAGTTGAISSDISCFLYLLGANDFSSEYFIGKKDPAKCFIVGAVGPGTYQLQLQPTASNARYLVDARSATGDGNDGFIESVNLPLDKSKSGVLDGNDIADWYKFSITKDTTATIEVTADQTTDCVIYLPEGVDQFGFSGPKCGTPYTFTASDEPYTIAVVRGKGVDNAKRITYLVKWH